MKIIQKLLCWLFSRIYRRWLWNEYHQTHDKVLKVFGWRSARVVTINKEGKEGSRRWMQPCFWIFD